MIFLHINILNDTDHKRFAMHLAEKMGKDYSELPTTPTDDLVDYCDDNSVDMLIFSCRNDKRNIQSLLNRCRELRLPYMFLTDTMTCSNLQHLVLPVTMLEEEVHKAQIAAHIARYNNAQITILQANDYGSRAEKNVQRIVQVLQRFEIEYNIIRATKDSFSITKEITDRQSDLKADMFILTASREYGLDDMFFGPPERHAIRRSLSPVLLVNPRADLYALCD